MAVAVEPLQRGRLLHPASHLHARATPSRHNRRLPGAATEQPTLLGRVPVPPHRPPARAQSPCAPGTAALAPGCRQSSPSWPSRQTSPAGPQAGQRARAQGAGRGAQCAQAAAAAAARALARAKAEKKAAGGLQAAAGPRRQAQRRPGRPAPSEPSRCLGPRGPPTAGKKGRQQQRKNQGREPGQRQQQGGNQGLSPPPPPAGSLLPRRWPPPPPSCAPAAASAAPAQSPRRSAAGTSWKPWRVLERWVWRWLGGGKH